MHRGVLKRAVLFIPHAVSSSRGWDDRDALGRDPLDFSAPVV
jgi:hypothetical protein